MSSFLCKHDGAPIKRARISSRDVDTMDEEGAQHEVVLKMDAAPPPQQPARESSSPQAMNVDESGWTSPEIEEIIQAFGGGMERSSVTFSPSQLAFPKDTFDERNPDYAIFDSSLITNRPDAIMGGVESRTSVARNTFKKYMTQPNPIFDKEITARESKEDEGQTNMEVLQIDAVRSYHTTGNRRVDPSSLGNPNNEIILRCVAAVIESEIRSAEESPWFLERNSTNFPEFDRKSGVTKDFQEKLSFSATNKDIMYLYILYYIDWVQRKLRYYSEVNIISLAYLYRLTSMSDLAITVQNWPNIWMTCVSMAAKMWQDTPYKCEVIALALKDVNKKHVREMERRALTLIQYDTKISSSLYAKYYFSLREMYGELFPGTEIYWGKPLSAVTAKRMDGRFNRGHLGHPKEKEMHIMM